MITTIKILLNKRKQLKDNYQDLGSRGCAGMTHNIIDYSAESFSFLTSTGSRPKALSFSLILADLPERLRR